MAIYACQTHVYIGIIGVKGRSVATPQYDLSCLISMDGY